MARYYARASTEYSEAAGAPATAVPLTMACWFNSTTALYDQCLMFIGDKDADYNYFTLMASGAVAGDPVRACAAEGEASRAATSTGYTANTWHHACGVFSATNSRTAYIDGGSAGTNTTVREPAGCDRVSIGRAGQSTAEDYMSGMIAEAAVWSVALSAADIAQLAHGQSPLLVQAASLVAYWPLIRGDNDWVGGYNLTAYNTPTFGAHPGRIIPVMLQMRLPFAITGAAGGQPARAMNLYRRRWSA